MFPHRGETEGSARAHGQDTASVYPCWRWRWDLNPRRGCPLTRFRGVRPRPLGDSTAGELTILAGLPALREEPAERRGAFAGEYAADHLWAVRQAAVP